MAQNQRHQRAGESRGASWRRCPQSQHGGRGCRRAQREVRPSRDHPAPWSSPLPAPCRASQRQGKRFWICDGEEVSVQACVPRFWELRCGPSPEWCLWSTGHAPDCPSPGAVHSCVERLQETLTSRGRSLPPDLRPGGWRRQRLAGWGERRGLGPGLCRPP